MADEQGEKKYDATPHHIEEARKKGDVSKSQDITGFLTLIVGLSVLFFSWEPIIRDFGKLFQSCINLDSPLVALGYLAQTFVKWMLIIALPIGTTGVLSHVMQKAVVFSPEAISPKFDKLNPVTNLKNVFSIESLFTSIKAIITTAILCIVLYATIKKVALVPVGDGLDLGPFVRTMMLGLLPFVLWFLGMSIADLVFATLRYKHKQKMTVQQMKDESKQTEGDQQVKSQQKAFRNKILKGSLRDNIAEADVVIVNPVHLAIAIRYNVEEYPAPIVVAKGARKKALKIKEIAREEKIPIVENPPVAQMLYRFVNPGEPIPPKFYKVVAEILAWVMQNNLKKYGNRNSS